MPFNFMTREDLSEVNRSINHDEGGGRQRRFINFMLPVEPAATKMFAWSAADASIEARESCGPGTTAGESLWVTAQYPVAGPGVRHGAQMRQLGES